MRGATSPDKVKALVDLVADFYVPRGRRRVPSLRIMKTLLTASETIISKLLNLLSILLRSC